MIIRYQFDEDAPLWAIPSNREKLERWLEERFPHPPGLRCAACGKDEWFIGHRIVLQHHSQGDPVIQLPFKCRHCGCYLHFALDHFDLEA